MARAIAREVLERSATRPRELTLTGQLVVIVNEGPLPARLSEFLCMYPNVVQAMVGHFSFGEVLYRVKPNLGGLNPDLAVGTFMGTSGSLHWQHFLFCPAEGSFFADSAPTGALKQAIDKLEHFEKWKWLPDNRTQEMKDLGVDDLGRHEGIILVGRRDHFCDSDRQIIRSFRERDIYIRSYDWLIEACIYVDPARNAERGSTVHAEESL
ncbi:MAG TPA: hypothetical protein VKB81_00655 [Nitrospira sp.]|nr:hypothetical protein [Nitrospira sp.]